MAKVNVDGKEYETDTLSENARSKLASLTYCDRKLNELKSEASIIQTARNAYARDLRRALQEKSGES